MPLRIVDSRPAQLAAWDALWKQCAHATFFESRAWAEVWEDYSRGEIRPAPVFLKFSDDRTAILPLSYREPGNKITRTALLSPAGTFGSWLCDAPLPIPHQEILFRHMTKNNANFLWRFNPYARFTVQPSDKRIALDQTHALALANGFEALSNSWKKKAPSLIRKIKKAQKEGITVDCPDGEGDWREYFEIYEKSLVRWGDKATSRYSWNLFRIFHTKKSEYIRLWTARFRGQIVAGGIFLYSPRNVVYWHGAALSEHFHLRPVNLLMQEVIRDACERALLWFDFNPSGGHGGVTSFKESFGAQPLPSSEFKTETKTAYFYKRLRRFFRYPHRAP